MTAVSVRQDGPKLHVSSPYDAGFVTGAKLLGGRWDPAGKTWSVPLAERDQLRALLLRVYRTDGGLPAPAARPGSRLPTVADLDKLLAAICVPAEGTP